jgi:NAD(P)-dependent dehydrogenase (short-subunit alcohol dehydrogenase family)
MTGPRDPRLEPPEVVGMVEDTVRSLGSLDILVNNAGIQLSRHSHELSAADFDRVPAVYLRGAFLCARESIRHFLERGSAGVVPNISRVHQRIPKPGYLGYSVSKGGMANLTTTRGRPSRSPRTSRCRDQGRPTRWPAWPVSSPVTRRRTSRARPSTSTAG